MAFAALANGRLRLAVRRKLEDAHYRRRWRRGHTPGTQTEPQLEAATSAGVILPETGQFLLLCSPQLWQQLQRLSSNSCKFFIRILLPFYGNSSPRTMFLRKANGYNRALALRNARQMLQSANAARRQTSVRGEESDAYTQLALPALVGLYCIIY